MPIIELTNVDDLHAKKIIIKKSKTENTEGAVQGFGCAGVFISATCGGGGGATGRRTSLVGNKISLFSRVLKITNTLSLIDSFKWVEFLWDIDTGNQSSVPG